MNSICNQCFPSVDMTWTSLMNSICNQCFLPLTSGYISNSSERSTPCQRNKTLVTYRIHQGGPHHVNGRKHWLHIEFIREVHTMSTEENRCGPPWWIHVMSTQENTGYISNSSERSTSCQRKKNTGYISNSSERSTSCQRKENTGYISNSSEMSTPYQRKKTLVTYRIHHRGPHHVNGRKQTWTSRMNSICNQCFSSVDMMWTSMMNSICNQCFLPLIWCGHLWWIRYVTSVFFPLTWCGPLWWIRYVTSVFFRWHGVDLSDEFDM